jgi:hypothetical protein
VTNSTQSDSRPLEELADLSVGLGILLMPLSAIVAAVVVPPFLLGRRLLHK